MAETKELSGALFGVADPKTPNDPKYTGSCVIDGRRYWIAGWVLTIPQGECNGEEYISLSFTPADELTPHGPARDASRPGSVTTRAAIQGVTR